MPELMVLVLNDPSQTHAVLDAWLAAGVNGVTLLESSGLAHVIGGGAPPEDLPLFPSLRDFLREREEPHRTLLALVPDGFDVDALAAATEAITGVLDEPHTGILFCLPVRRAWGLQRKK